MNISNSSNSNSNPNLNTQPLQQQQYKVLTARETIYIENTKSQQVICIDRSYYSIRPLTDYKELIETEILFLKNVDSILGIIEIESSKYLLVIWESRSICQVLSIEIKSILQIDLILISHTEHNPNSKDLLRKHLKRVLCNGFYYSNGFDLTRSLQEKEEYSSINMHNPFHSMKNVNCDFMWNYHLIQSFMSYNIDKSFIACCIYGYVATISHTMNSVPCQFTLISKRLTHQFSIYNNEIGLMEIYGNNNNNSNKKSNTDNRLHCNDFVETECITQIKSNLFSFTICSSTIPLHYKHNKSLDNTYNDLISYLDDLLGKYKKIVIVNIINGSLEAENEIRKTLDSMIKAYDNKGIRYLDIDTSSLLDCEIIVKQNATLCDYLGLYGRYMGNIIIQKGVFYIVSNNICNTKNDFIMSLAWYYLQKQFELSGIESQPQLQSQSSHNSIDLLSDINTQSNTNTMAHDKEELMTLFSEKWIKHKKALEYERKPPADNYHIQIINQRILDYIIDDNSIKRKYSRSKRLNIFVGSFNAAGITPSFNYNLTNWFTNNINKDYNPYYSPDLIVIGMQEIVELNASNILIKSNEERVKLWKGFIYKGITQAFPNEDYIPIKDLNLVGILFICFTKNGIDPIIKQSVINKTGALGTMGNKGNCLLSISYLSSSIALATGHFCAGQNSNDKRLSQLNEILNMPLLNASNVKTRFRDFSHWFIFGDMNFRVEKDYDEAIGHLKLNDINTLLNADQFLTVRRNMSGFNDVCEGVIKFMPTFKYVIDSDEFDRQKMRTPSWCDRIFYKSTEDVKLLEYNIVNKVKYSDHRPVYAIFDLNCTQSIDNEKMIILEEIRGHDEACTQNAFIVENALVIDINKPIEHQSNINANTSANAHISIENKGSKGNGNNNINLLDL